MLLWYFLGRLNENERTNPQKLKVELDKQKSGMYKQ